MSSATSRPAEGAPRVLLVVRHAKAEAAAASDHDRDLTERGKRDATEAGAWLVAHELVPDRALVSTAVRTRRTWERVAAGSGSAAAVEYDDALYSAGPDAALEILRTAPAETRVLAYVGHNPAAAYVAQLLNDGAPDPDAFRAMAAGFPPASVAVYAVDVPWAELDAGTGRLVAFHVGDG